MTQAKVYHIVKTSGNRLVVAFKEGLFWVDVNTLEQLYEAVSVVQLANSQSVELSLQG